MESETSIFFFSISNLSFPVAQNYSFPDSLCQSLTSGTDSPVSARPNGRKGFAFVHCLNTSEHHQQILYLLKNSIKVPSLNYF